jgi:acyl-CoA thioesterase-1
MPFAFQIFTVTYGVRARIAKAFALLALVALASLMARSATAEGVKVAALGDSLTAGYGLPADQGLVPQLQAWLAAKGVDATIVNAGVSGDTSAGGLARMDWTLTPDVQAMIVALGGNDLLRGIDPAVTKANLDAILAKAQARGVPVLLVGLTATNNYGPDFKAAFDAIYPDLSAKYDTLLLDNFFRPLLDHPSGLAAFMQPDGIHPNESGVKMIVEHLGPSVLELVSAVPR